MSIHFDLMIPISPILAPKLLKELELLHLFHKNNVSRDEKLMLGGEYVTSFLNDAIVFSSYTVI